MKRSHNTTPVSSNWFVSLPTLFALHAISFVVTLVRLHILPLLLQLVAVLPHHGNPLQSLFRREASLIPRYTSTFLHALLHQHLHRPEPLQYSLNRALRQPLKTSLQPSALKPLLSLQTKTSLNPSISYSNKKGKNLILNCIS